jgi:glycosyltransferase involved in cell wall biosynthesis
VSSVPGFSIRLGTDLQRLPQAITAFLRSPASTPDAPADAPSTASPKVAPLVSVIIPVYNGAAFIADAVRAVTRQDYHPVEIIVVDDGSSEDIAAALRDVPVDVRLFRQDNGGAASARNRGIRDASGDVIAFLDADDLWPPGNLAAMVDHLLAHPDVDVVRGRAQVTRYTTAGDAGEYLGNPAESFPHYIGAGLYRRRAFEKVGLFDADLRFAEDTDWYSRAAEKKLPILHVDEVTLFVRRHDGNMTRGKTIVELNQLRLFKKMLDRRRAE